MPFNADPHISKTPGFPKDGITFYDISPILEDCVVAKQAMTALAEFTHPMKPDIIAGIDARGFLFALPLALELDCGMVMVRKAGKLPGDVAGTILCAGIWRGPIVHTGITPAERQAGCALR